MTSTTAGQTVSDQISAIAGREYTSVERDVYSVAPADAQQASAALRFADEQGLAVRIEGAGSKQGWLKDGRHDLRLLTRRMNTVREHTWQDMTCTVEAGCTWQAMQTVLAKHGQQVALDPLWPERATIGGVVGTNDSGSLRLRYGGLRDLVIGMSLVLADGTVARSGGKVVKNVAGYDLSKLLCGSFGTLALIAEVTFRLHALARHTASFTVTAATAEPLGGVLLRLLDSHFSLQSMQLRTAAGGFALDLRLAALPEVLTAQEASLAGAVRGMGLHAESAEAYVWDVRKTLFAADSLVIKTTMLPTEIASTVQAIHNSGGSAVAQATGIVTASYPLGAPLSEVASLRARLEAGGGSLTVLKMPAGISLDRWGALPSGFPLMRAIKRQFDPHGTLNPQRFLGCL